MDPLSVFAEITRTVPVSSAERASEAVVEGIDPNGFLGQKGLIMDVELSPSLGFAQVDPIRRMVTGSVESGPFDEGLHQCGPASVSMLPVVSELTSGHSQNTGREVLTVDPGQAEEAGVVHQELKSRLPLFGRPTDEQVARLSLPSSSPETEKSDDAIIGMDEVP